MEKNVRAHTLWLRSTRLWNLPFHCGRSTPFLLDYENVILFQHHSCVEIDGGGDDFLRGRGVYQVESSCTVYSSSCRKVGRRYTRVFLYFLRCSGMHISWLAFGVGCTVGTFFKIFKMLACSFSISIQSTISLCMGIKIRFTPASLFYTTENCVCLYTHFVLLSTFDCKLLHMLVIFI